MNRDLVSKLMMFLGIATVMVTFWGTRNFIFPFYPHTYPFAWYGLILFLDGLLWWRWNDGLILKKPREFAILLFWSAVFWFFFECWNLRLRNWYFVGVPPEGLWPHVEAYLDFATVLPGMFLLYRLLCCLRIPKSARTGFVLGGQIHQASLAIGFFMLALPLVFPDYFFPFVWGALIFLLEPVCARFGARSLIVDGQKGEWTTFVRLLLAGILCGGYWELCNFWSLEKWIYTVPFFSQGKLFEMPYLGFLGFPPFCVQCFVMINALYLFRHDRHWDPDAPIPHLSDNLKSPRWMHKAVYCMIMVFAVCMSEWCYAKMKVYTIDSRSESLHLILDDISPAVAGRLEGEGWHYPKQILGNWKEAEGIIEKALRERIEDPSSKLEEIFDRKERCHFMIRSLTPQQATANALAIAVRNRLELVSLLNMGTANARLLESTGIDSQKKLGEKNPNELFPSLIKTNQRLGLRSNPLPRRRVTAWINAAGRKSAFY